jgi:hypothetical protein
MGIFVRVTFVVAAVIVACAALIMLVKLLVVAAIVAALVIGAGILLRMLGIRLGRSRLNEGPVVTTLTARR